MLGFILKYFNREIRQGRKEERKEGREEGRKGKISGFPGGAVVKNPPANAGDTGLSPGLGRSHMPRSN